MDGLFWFSFLLFSLPVTGSTGKDKNCFSQHEMAWQKTEESVVLRCTISPLCLTGDVQFEWFYFKENSHLRLNLDSNPKKYNLEEGSLRIMSLHTNDSGIYHCATESRGEPTMEKQLVGLGTTLVVRENVDVMVKNVLLWLSFVLLAIYSLAIVTLIMKKNGCSVGVCRRTHKTYQNNSIKKRQFRDVLHEFKSRNNLERSKQAASVNPPHIEAANTDFNGSPDDIYQNV